MNHTKMIIAMYKNEIGINKIAKVLEIKTAEVYECLRKSNLLRKDVNQERDKKVCALYSDNTKIVKISEMLNIDRHTVTNILKRYNLYNEYKKIKLKRYFIFYTKTQQYT